MSLADQAVGEGASQVMYDLVYDRIVGDEGNYFHPGPFVPITLETVEGGKFA
jgi:hypothetical protein